MTDDRQTTGVEKFVRSIPGSALIAFSFGEGLLATSEAITGGITSQIKLTLWIIIILGIGLSFGTKFKTGVSGEKPLKWDKVSRDANGLGPYMKLLIYCSLIAFQALLYAIALFRSVLLSVEWQLPAPYLVGALGFVMALVISSTFNEDTGFLQAVSRYNMACGLAKANDHENSLVRLGEAKTLCESYITKSKLDNDPDFIHIKSHTDFKKFRKSLRFP